MTTAGGPLNVLHVFGRQHEAASWPVLSFVRKFREEFEARGATDEARASVSVARPTREWELSAK